jgi:hypothetical protein
MEWMNTVLRRMRKRSFTYVPLPSSSLWPIFTKIANSLQHSVHISYTEFHPHRKINV